MSLRSSLLSPHRISQGQWDLPLLSFPLKIFLPEAYGSDFQHFSNIYLFIKGENEDCNFTPTLPYLMQNVMHIMCHLSRTFVKLLLTIVLYIQCDCLFFPKLIMNLKINVLELRAGSI